MTVFKKLKLKKEANLLDGGLFILKTFFAISAAYLLTHNHPFISKDMISVLFGLILTLEPVTITGVKNGWDQVFASFIGAISTALIISLLGVNAFTIGLSVAFTLYVCLLINWRSVSPVALFTAIYMTQYLQTGANGLPDIFLTVQLRFAALISGVAVAIVFNYLFSIIQYRIITNKRTIYLLKRLRGNIVDTKSVIGSGDPNEILQIRSRLLDTSNGIEYVANLFNDMSKEASAHKKLFFINNNAVDVTLNILIHLRNIEHLIFDINYMLSKQALKGEDIKGLKGDLTLVIEQVEENLKHLEVVFAKNQQETDLTERWLDIPEDSYTNPYAERIYKDFIDINKNIREIATLKVEKL